MKLRDKLKRDNPNLYGRLIAVETNAKKLLEYSQGGIHVRFTTHGLSHIVAVEACYDWLLSEQDIESFKPLEIFCLLCATFFHDVLMIPKRLGTEKEARETHASEAQNFLLEHKELIGIDINEATVIGQVILGHGVSDLSDIDGHFALGHDLIELHKLAACLSMADICHADASRAPEIVFGYLELDEESARHWKRHLLISGITRKDDKILMSAVAFSDEGECALNEYKESIEEQLKIVNPYFHPNGRLSPISSIELRIKRLDSPLDRTFSFQANMPAILDVLITGIYERTDVFIRELIQNSLDACYLQVARSFRRCESYSPKILVTLYKDDGNLVAVRIDDSGIGMDIYDVQDTLLWIGNTVSDKESVRQLLGSTTQKSLIASFGIGILSCFKVAEEILVRTCKEKSTPIEFSIKGISEIISPIQSHDDSIGTTMIVKLKDNALSFNDAKDAVSWYCRMVEQVELSTLELEYADETESYSRKRILQIAMTEAEDVEPLDYSSESCFCEMKGEDFRGWFWIDDPYVDAIEATKGTIEILNDGIFVCDAPAAKWIPKHLAFFSGVINFAAKSIDLPVSRDRVQENEKLSRKRRELDVRSSIFFRKLVELTKQSSRRERRLGVFCLSFALSQVSDEWKERFIRNIDGYEVSLFDSRRRVPLNTIRDDKPDEVYVEYEYEYVNKAGELDGKPLYHSKVDIAKLQAAMLVQDNKWVVHCETFEGHDEDISEVTLLTEYLEKYGIKVVDLITERPKKLRSRPISKSNRPLVGSSVKFVEIGGTPNQRAWSVGEEVWINIANPSIGRIYELLQSDGLSREEKFLVRVLIQILSLKIDDAINQIIRKLSES